MIKKRHILTSKLQIEKQRPQNKTRYRIACDKITPSLPRISKRALCLLYWLSICSPTPVSSLAVRFWERARVAASGMVRWARSCLRSALKLMNSVIGLAGMGMILYSLWMIRSWYKDIDDGYSFGADSSPPWFIYTFLGLGIFLCLITCVGHVAAETANSHCLSCFMILVFLLIILESAITADILLNRNWEEDFPEDPTGKFDELKKFVRLNYIMCQWIGLLIVAAQALSIVMAMVLKALGPDCEIDYDSDDDFVTTRLPLLRNQVLQTGNGSIS